MVTLDRIRLTGLLRKAPPLVGLSTSHVCMRLVTASAVTPADTETEIVCGWYPVRLILTGYVPGAKLEIFHTPLPFVFACLVEPLGSVTTTAAFASGMPAASKTAPPS